MSTPLGGMHPGGRLQSAEHAGQQTVSEVPETVAPESNYSVATWQAAANHGRYSTITIPESATNAPSVRQLLPYDESRKIAYIMTIDEAIIIATSQDQVSVVTNVASTINYPSGSWVPTSLLIPVTHCEAVYAVNTSTSALTRVSVFVETGGPAQ